MVDGVTAVRYDGRMTSYYKPTRDAIEAVAQAMAKRNSDLGGDSRVDSYLEAAEAAIIAAQPFIAAETWDETCAAVAWATEHGPDPLHYVAENNPYRKRLAQHG